MKQNKSSINRHKGGKFVLNTNTPHSPLRYFFLFLFLAKDFSNDSLTSEDVEGLSCWDTDLKPIFLIASYDLFEPSL